MGALLGGIWAKLALAGAAAAGFLLWLAGQKREAVKADRAKQTEKTIQKVEDIRDARADNRLRSDDELRDRLLRDNANRKPD